MSPKPGRGVLACPHCGSLDSIVTDTRDAPWKLALQLVWPGRGIWRRHRCETCQRCFGSREYIWPPPDKSSTLLNR